MNIANLLNCKKYKLTKEKEESFKRPKEPAIKPYQPCLEVANDRSSNLENDMNVGNKANIGNHMEGDSAKITNDNRLKAEEGERPELETVRSPEGKTRPDFSFKKPIEGMASNTKSFECSSISKQEKDIEKRVF